MDPPVDTNVNALVSCVSLFTHIIATVEYMGGYRVVQLFSPQVS